MTQTLGAPVRPSADFWAVKGCGLAELSCIPPTSQLWQWHFMLLLGFHVLLGAANHSTGQ